MKKTGSKTENRGQTSHRVARVEREIREVVSAYLVSGFRGNLPGIISISRIQASPDLRSARVYFTLLSNLPSPNEMDDKDADAIADRDEKYENSLKAQRESAVKELRAHAYDVQHAVGQRLQMRFTPTLSFFYDEGFENALRVESILREIGKNRPASDGESENDSDSDGSGE